MKFTRRIKKGKTFKYILKKGNYISGKYLVLHVCQTKYSHYNFFGVCVSKKNGNSVQRNRLKRWVREVYKLEEEKLKKGYNLVFLYKKTTTIEQLNFHIIKEEMSHSLKKIGLYEHP